MRKILEAIVVGLLFVLGTHIAEKYLPDNLQFIVESKLIWLIPAFLVAYNMPLRRKQSDSIAISIVTLLSTGLTYYLSEVIKNGRAFQFPSNTIIVIVISVVVGAAIGLIAYYAHSATNQIIRYGSVSILPAIYTGDGINEIIQTINNFQFTPEIGVKVLGGIAFYILIAGHNKFKKKSLLVFFVLATITTLVYLYMV